MRSAESDISCLKVAKARLKVSKLPSLGVTLVIRDMKYWMKQM